MSDAHSSKTETIGAEARLDVPRPVKHEDVSVGTLPHQGRFLDVERVDDDGFDKLVGELRTEVSTAKLGAGRQTDLEGSTNGEEVPVWFATGAVKGRVVTASNDGNVVRAAIVREVSRGRERATRTRRRTS